MHPLWLKGGLDLFYAVLVPFDWIHVEGVIELLSHCDDGASQIVPAFVIGDRNDEAEAQCENNKVILYSNHASV